MRGQTLLSLRDGGLDLLECAAAIVKRAKAMGAVLRRSLGRRCEFNLLATVVY